MNKLVVTGILVGIGVISGCGESPEQPTGSRPAAGRMDSSTLPADPAVELIASFEMSGTAPYDRSTVEATLNCQRATPGSPFRAQWIDKETGVSILVTGWPNPDQGHVHKVDNFQIAQLTAGPGEKNARDARLSSATLTVEPLSSSGAMTYYAVQADGVFAEGGTFSAAGTCKA